MFIDWKKVILKAGDGGSGCVHFRKKKYSIFNPFFICIYLQGKKQQILGQKSMANSIKSNFMMHSGL